MRNFDYHNPVKVVFGEGVIARLGELIPPAERVLLTYGGGSILANGVHAQVMAALEGRPVHQFGGIEPNPRFETCMRAVELCRREGITFLLAVGGGSVLDGTKFIAAAVPFSGDPWAILERRAPVASALPVGCVLTLPATGSEMNGFAVISREATHEKLPFASPHVYPRFAVLDPATTFSLDGRQVGNGIVDTWVHVLEQYLTYPDRAPLQDRQAEAILLTLREEGPRVLAEPRDYAVRANLMWCATQALNGLIGCGVPQDWTTHMIGHELTALYGIDHGQSLAAVLPGTLRYGLGRKRAKLLQYGERVWGITAGGEEARATEAIVRTADFFEQVGVPARLSAYGIDKAAAGAEVTRRLEARGARLGEHGDLGGPEAAAILALCD